MYAFKHLYMLFDSAYTNIQYITYEHIHNMLANIVFACLIYFLRNTKKIYISKTKKKKNFASKTKKIQKIC